jgi:hypothetical protein
MSGRGSARVLTAIVAVAFGGYLALGLAVGNLYPISTYEMYAGEQATAGSRLAVRTADGDVVEIDRFVDWRCPERVPTAPTACGVYWPFYHVPYLDRAAVEHIEEHAGDGDEPVAVIRRIWRLSRDGGIAGVEDCPVASCRARRAP